MAGRPRTTDPAANRCRYCKRNIIDGRYCTMSREGRNCDERQKAHNLARYQRNVYADVPDDQRSYRGDYSTARRVLHEPDAPHRLTPPEVVTVMNVRTGTTFKKLM